MSLSDYLGTALSISVVMTIIFFIMGYRNKEKNGKQKSYWKMSCVFGGIAVVIGIAALVLMLM